MLIWPAIDLRGGRCVRLRQGDFDRETSYDGDPIEIAGAFCEQGADGIHVVDLDGARSGFPAHLELLQSMSKAVDIPIEFGGGIRTAEAIRKALESGARRVVLGTQIARDPAFARSSFQEFGEAVVAGIDSNNGKVAVSGWLEATDLDELDFALSIYDCGCARAIVTDISRDGMMMGPNLQQLRAMVSNTGLAIVASGGIGSIQDIVNVAETGAEGVIIGRALYEGVFSVEEACRTVNARQQAATSLTPTDLPRH